MTFKRAAGVLVLSAIALTAVPAAISASAAQAAATPTKTPGTHYEQLPPVPVMPVELEARLGAWLGIN